LTRLHRRIPSRDAVLDVVRPFLKPVDREPVLGDLAEAHPRLSWQLVRDAARIVLRELGCAWLESPVAMVFAISAALVAETLASLW